MSVTDLPKNNDKLRRELAAANYLLEQNITALQEAQALTHLGSWRWDVDTGAVFWSDELYRIYGLKPQERKIGFQDFLELIYLDDRARIGAVIGAAFKSGEPFDFEHRIMLPDKKLRILYGKGTAVRGDSGAIIAMIGTSQDITDKKKADDTLFLSDERFKAVTAATNDVIYDADLVESLTWFNNALFSEYGYPERSIRPRQWFFDNIHPEDVTRITQSIDKALVGTDINWSADYRLKRHSGNYVDVRDRAHIVRDADFNAIRIIGSILDISQQKELGRAKDKFISLVSHQLRTPLTAMRLHTEMLADGQGGELNSKGQTYVEKIETSTVRMIQLVSDILNVSQIERGRLKAVPVPTDITALIAWHIDEISPSAASKQATIVFKPAESLPLVSVDPLLFSQIMHNLLSNAVRYTQAPDSIITVSFIKTNTGYELCVKDQGIGIPKSVQRKVFTSFFRAENAVKMHGEGTGLGLYFIKLIVESTGGKTWFETTENIGSSFYVTLPLSGMVALDQLQPMPLELHV